MRLRAAALLLAAVFLASCAQVGPPILGPRASEEERRVDWDDKVVLSWAPSSIVVLEE